jgi:hypothetical protein
MSSSSRSPVSSHASSSASIPRLEQVVVDVDLVDRLDRGVGVRVRGEQRPPRVGEQVHRLLQEIDAVHLGHPVVGQHHRDPAAAQLQLTQRVQGVGRRGGPDDAVVLAVPAAQVTGDGTGDGGVVVDGQDRGMAHVSNLRSVRKWGRRER